MRSTLLLAALLLPLPALAQTPAALLEDAAGNDLLVLPAAGGLLVPGRFGAAIPAEGPGSRLMWHAGKSAFRAGGAFGTTWDNANVGSFSAAFGDRNTASGFASTALGRETTASGTNATAMGFQTTAAATNSTALGSGTTASASASVAMGLGTTAPHAAGLVAGQYNDPTECDSPFLPRNVLFSVGYGTSSAARRNVLTVCATNASTGSDLVTAHAGLLVSEFSIFEAGVTVDQFLSVGEELNVGDDVGVDGTVTADAFVESSDRRLKADVAPLGRVLDRLLGIAPVTYRLREGDGAREVGLIAQEVRGAFPELVTEGEDGMLAVSYTRLTAVLLAGLREQQAEIAATEARVAALEARLAARADGHRPLQSGAAGLALALGLALAGGVGYGLRRTRPTA